MKCAYIHLLVRLLFEFTTPHSIVRHCISVIWAHDVFVYLSTLHSAHWILYSTILAAAVCRWEQHNIGCVFACVRNNARRILSVVNTKPYSVHVPKWTLDGHRTHTHVFEQIWGVVCHVTYCYKHNSDEFIRFQSKQTLNKFVNLFDKRCNDVWTTA